uniref:Uncharacterized protein n=1 Tax=Lepeophtheirus salmonis TaxID=72036 RepID=A0A0K2VIV0_LEPSM
MFIVYISLPPPLFMMKSKICKLYLTGIRDIRRNQFFNFRNHLFWFHIIVFLPFK